eukprot:CAMPEP_0178923036 /NCGR_PEP_ID=MMETSP0786-20121207/16496_1 /TAXON_ID=186022 /ORGANISM="Thalassionema frauenfeldii, Strain CCMP 1798" /LENGTH=421 /DNA_ID=CAMNT_0020597487 /DNA_START=2447 /DNA_END=3712 /DNA_ORIENTATION=+
MAKTDLQSTRNTILEQMNRETTTLKNNLMTNIQAHQQECQTAARTQVSEDIQNIVQVEMPNIKATTLRAIQDTIDSSETIQESHKPSTNLQDMEPVYQELRATSIEIQSTAEHDFQNNIDLIVTDAETNLQQKLQEIIDKDTATVADCKSKIRHKTWDATKSALKDFETLLTKKKELYKINIQHLLRDQERNINAKLVDHNKEITVNQGKHLTEYIDNITKETTTTLQKFTDELQQATQHQLHKFQTEIENKANSHWTTIQTEKNEQPDEQGNNHGHHQENQKFNETTSNNYASHTHTGHHQPAQGQNIPQNSNTAPMTFRGQPIHLNTPTTPNPYAKKYTKHPEQSPNQPTENPYTNTKVPLHQFRKDEITTPISEISNPHEIRNLYRNFETSLQTYDLPIIEFNQLKSGDYMTLPKEAH